MAPKKKDDAAKAPQLIGRMGTNLKIGIVGLPNVGYEITALNYLSSILRKRNMLTMIL